MISRFANDRGNARWRGRYQTVPVAALVILVLFAILTGAVRCTNAETVVNRRKPILYTSAQIVRGLSADDRGNLWAATAGGVVRWSLGELREKESHHAPRIWTTSDGLPANDVQQVRVLPSGDMAVTLAAGRWTITPSGRIVEGKGDAQHPTASAGKPEPFATETAGVRVPGGKTVMPLPPDSRASHVSALITLPDGNALAALYGDGLYLLQKPAPAKSGWQWVRCADGNGTEPPDARQFVTALALLPGGVAAIGTRNNGTYLWDMQDTKLGRAWQPLPLPGPNTLPCANIYALAGYRNRLYAATFDAGVVAITPQGVVAYPQIVSPRALAVWQDKLYALDANHRVQVFDGATWQPAWDKFALPRPDVYALAVDATRNRLLIGGWGGWAEWDGREWRGHWRTSALNNEGVTAITADRAGAVWVGTQRRGLFRFGGDRDRDGDTATPFQEAQGLTDDWITCLAMSPTGRLLVGTYTGGLLTLEGERLVSRLRVQNWAIRTIAFDASTGAAMVATPVGSYREPTNGTSPWSLVDPTQTGGGETQAFLPTPNGLWVGTRSGLAFVIK